MPSRSSTKRRKEPKNPRGPGRPGGASSARQRIVDAAEVVFSEHGYEGASLRDIVVHANVTQALINYYFKSKQELFTEVYLRRSREIVERRTEALEKFERAGKPYTLEQLLSAFLNPALAMRQTRAGRAFIRLQSRVHTEPPEFVKRLRRQVFDESTRRYVQAIRKTLPQISEKTAFWRIILVIGAYAYVYSDAHRLEEISGGVCDSSDLNEMIAQTRAFIVGGMMAPLRTDGKRKRHRPRARKHSAAALRG